MYPYKAYICNKIIWLILTIISKTVGKNSSQIFIFGESFQNVFRWDASVFEVVGEKPQKATKDDKTTEPFGFDFQCHHSQATASNILWTKKYSYYKHSTIGKCKKHKGNSKYNYIDCLFLWDVYYSY